MSSYEDLLARALKQVPPKTGTGERFELPRVITMRAGQKTVFVNFNELATALRREPDHLLKFLLKELATKYEWAGTQLVLQGKFPAELINRKIELYVKMYVVCPECKKPDSKLVKEDGFTFLKCEACGAKHVVGKV